MVSTDAILEEIQSCKNTLDSLQPNDNRSFWITRHLARLTLELEISKNHVGTFNY